MPRTRRLLTLLPVLALVAAAHVPAAAASSTQTAIFQDDGGLLSNPAGTISTLRALGATQLRVFVPWGSIAPAKRPSKAFNATNPAAYPAGNWAPYDAIVRDAQAAGLSVLFDVNGPTPTWARGAGWPHNRYGDGWKPNAAAFGSFVKAIGTRYSGTYAVGGRALPRVHFWSVWNEPNYGPSLSPQSSDGGLIQLAAASYRALLGQAYTALRGSGHGSDTILFGETAPHGYTNGGNFSGVAPLEFLRGLYCLNSHFRELRGSLAAANGCPTTAAGSSRFRTQNPALFSASAFAAHPYAQGTPPNKSLKVKGQDAADFADLASIGKLESTLDHANRVYGSHTRFPLYSTEYGFQTDPPEHPVPNSVFPLPPTVAAAYMNWAEYISYKNARIVSYDQYLLVDPPGGNFASGLEFSNGAHKPGYDAYRMPLYLPVTSIKKASALEIWGGVRPAPEGGLSQTAQIQFQAGSSGSFTTLQSVAVTNPQGYFDVRLNIGQSGTIRVAWKDPANGQTYYSRSVGVTVG